MRRLRCLHPARKSLRDQSPKIARHGLPLYDVSVPQIPILRTDLFPPSRSSVPLRKFVACYPSNRIRILILCAAVTFAGGVAAEMPPSAAPISRTDIQQITRVIRAVTKKPILMIAGVLEDTYVPGAVTGNAYELDTNTGKRKPQYIRTDLVSVYMRYTDRSHVDVYVVRKLRGRWTIESKKNWFL